MTLDLTGKFIIGLTGNIGTGKSTVRKMLEHLGAFGIDADALSHDAIARDSQGYTAAIEAFGSLILNSNADIDRARLGKLVFSDAAAMQILENIIHPLVSQAVDDLIMHANQPVIVIEAIKLLESDLTSQCDTVWVVDVPQTVQVQRLMDKRHHSREEALQRIHFQADPQIKIAAANVIILNDGSARKTWEQVLANWNKIPCTHSPVVEPDWLDSV